MKVRLIRDLPMSMAKEGDTFYVKSVSTDADGKGSYFVDFYGNTIAFPADACDVDAVGFAAADRIANQNTNILALQREIEKLRGQVEAIKDETR